MGSDGRQSNCLQPYNWRDGASSGNVLPVVGQFQVREAITEPSAVAPDARVNFSTNQVGPRGLRWILLLPKGITEVDSSIRRYRARFCIECVASALLSDDLRRCSYLFKLTRPQRPEGPAQIPSQPRRSDN